MQPPSIERKTEINWKQRERERRGKTQKRKKTDNKLTWNVIKLNDRYQIRKLTTFGIFQIKLMRKIKEKNIPATQMTGVTANQQI